MRDGAPMTRRSEMMQRLLNRRECPYLFDCKFPVTRNFFGHICNSDGYLKCHYFAKRVAHALPFARMRAQCPMLWLQEERECAPIPHTYAHKNYAPLKTWEMANGLEKMKQPEEIE